MKLTINIERIAFALIVILLTIYATKQHKQNIKQKDIYEEAKQTYDTRMYKALSEYSGLRNSYYEKYDSLVLLKRESNSLKTRLKTANYKISHFKAILDTLSQKQYIDTIFIDLNPEYEFNLQLIKAELEECKTGLSVQKKINQGIIEN